MCKIAMLWAVCIAIILVPIITYFVLKSEDQIKKTFSEYEDEEESNSPWDNLTPGAKLIILFFATMPFSIVVGFFIFIVAAYRRRRQFGQQQRAQHQAIMLSELCSPAAKR